MDLISGVILMVLKSAWTWVLSGITAGIYAGYKIWHNYQDKKIRAENAELKWELKKKQFEEEAKDEANKDIDDPYDILRF